VLKKIGLFLAVFVSILMGVYFATDYYVTKKVTRKIDRKIEALKPETDIKYEDCDVSLFSKTIKLENIRIIQNKYRKPITIKEALFYKVDRNHKIPYYLGLKLENFTFPISSISPEVDYFISLLDYQGNFTGDFSIDYFFNKEDRSFDLNKFKLDVDGVGSISLTSELSDVPVVKKGDSLETLIFRMLSIKLKHGRLIYKDRGLFKRAVLAVSKYKKLSPEVVKKKVISRIESDGNISPNLKKSLIGFVNSPDTVIFEFSSETPVSIGSILFKGNGAEFFKKIDVKVMSVNSQNP